jgi:hypothetical protein
MDELNIESELQKTRTAWAGASIAPGAMLFLNLSELAAQLSATRTPVAAFVSDGGIQIDAFNLAGQPLFLAENLPAARQAWAQRR